MNVREIAKRLLCEYEDEGKYVNLSLSSHITDGLTGEERSFLTALVYTAVERKITYDYYISALSKRSIDKIDSTTKNILRLGIVQILDMDKIPDFAAVNETVKLSKNKGARAFINAVLHRVIENKASLPLPDRAKNEARYLSVKYSFSLFIVKRLISIFGSQEAEQILIAFSEITPTDISVNTTKISREEYLQGLKLSGYSAEINPLSPISIRINSSVDPRRLSGYEGGEFYVQGASSAAAVSALAPKRGELVVDVCSAPGGKSFAAAILMQNEGEVYSYDLHESKLSLISSGATRLGIDVIRAECRDSTVPCETLFGKADRVICDVPCSGLGVLAKKPDLRYKSEEGALELPTLQLKILTESAKYLKVGGVLLYSTCTLIPEENGGVLEAFLRENPDFAPLDFKCGEYESTSGMLTLLPHIHKTDGFFISLVKRVK